MNSAQATTNQLTEIYTLLCRSGLNRDYYGIALARVQVVNTWLEIVVAAGTAGSGLSALTIWNTEYGKIIWATLTVVATLLAVAKPVLQINKRVERLTRLYAGHSDNYSNLLILASRIKRKGQLTEEMQNAFEAAEARYLELSKEDDPHPNLRLLRTCQERVALRHPPESFWYPPSDTVETPPDESDSDWAALRTERFNYPGAGS